MKNRKLNSKRFDSVDSFSRASKTDVVRSARRGSKMFVLYGFRTAFVSSLVPLVLAFFISTGFATWILTGNGAFGFISVSADSETRFVISADQSFGNGGCKAFTFCADGFVNDYTVVDQGEVVYGLRLDNDLLYSGGFDLEGGQAKLEGGLSFSSFSLGGSATFNFIYAGRVAISCSGEVLSSQVQTGNLSFVVSVPINTESDFTVFTITFTFSLLSGDDLSTIANSLSSNNVFTIDLEVA